MGKKLVRFPELEAGALFKTVDEEDISDHAQIFEIIEDILSMAPRRVDNLPDLLPSGSKKVKKCVDFGLLQIRNSRTWKSRN